uniref:Secreted protein n=1 Tax=Arundo donax TaxID=35708 RepID=A0A0A9DXM1_ARUDO
MPCMSLLVGCLCWSVWIVQHVWLSSSNLVESLICCVLYCVVCKGHVGLHLFYSLFGMPGVHGDLGHCKAHTGALP